MKKLFSVMVLTLLLSSMLAFNIQAVKASGAIYIRADGSIDPPTASIQRNGDLYTLTDNIYESIEVQRNNTMIDGNKYLVQGIGSGGGFNLTSVSNVTIKNTNIKNFYTGIIFFASSNCSIIENNITANTGFGIGFDSRSSNNRVYGSNITDNLSSGIWFGFYSNNNFISKNNIINNGGHGILNSECSNTTISENNIVENVMSGIFLGTSSYPSYNIVCENNIANNGRDGIWLEIFDYCNNRISGNNITNNNGAGIYVTLMHGAPNNTVYHNSFISNTIQVNVTSAISSIKWDNGYPSGGNYWSNYTGVDLHSGSDQDEAGSDGIGDTAHEIVADNVDRYPLMGRFNTFDTGTWDALAYNIDVVSNSTVSNFQVGTFEKTISLNITGVEETTGFCRVTIPNIIVEQLWQGNYTVLLNDEPWPFRNWTGQENTYLYLNYTHSEHQIIIIPEFPSATILSLCMLTTLIAAILLKKKRKTKHQIP